MTRFSLLKSLFAATILIAISTQCTHRYYAPNSIQMPVLGKKGDAKVSAGISFGPEYKGLETQAVFSPIKYGAVMANYFRAGSNKTQNFQGAEEWGNGQLYEFGLGGYYPINQTSPTSTVSAFTGWGQGKTYNYYGNGKFADLRFDRFFIQSSIASQFKVLHLGFGVRFAKLTYRSGVLDYRIDENDRNILLEIEKRGSVWLPEYALQFGWKVGAVTFNNVVTYSPSQTSQTLQFAGSNINFSAIFDINRIFMKKKKQ
jgi:hypothetical protein